MSISSGSDTSKLLIDMGNGDFLHNERALLQEIARGDKAAFKTLHDHYWNYIYVTAISFLHSPAWAMDVVQDVFIKLWIRREDLPGVDNLRSYLFITARNELISALRKKLRTDLLNQQYTEQQPAQSALPEDALLLKQLEHAVNEGVAQLPAQQKLMYLLTRHEGLSHDEIASRLGITKKTVSNTTTRALQNLRKYLQGRGDLSV